MIQFSGKVQPPPSKPAFRPGDLIEHVRYGYRGVIVDLDLTCQSNEDWYQSNRTQPDRNQPWYHVLVDGAQHATYVAQQNLIQDKSGNAVTHPLLGLFFSKFDNGAYIRNDRRWGQ